MNKQLVKFLSLFILNKEKRHEFRNKYLNKNLNNSLLEHWTINGISKKIKIYENNYNLSATNHLIYASVLLEINNKKQCEIILKEYITKYNDLDFLSRFLPLSYFADSKNITNDKIKDSAFMFEIFNKNEKNKIFENFVKDKIISIVGNGPSEIGKNKGEEIDKNDLVIRFNNFCINNYEKDYGHKTNIWLYCNANNINFRDISEIEKLDMIVFEGDIYHVIFENNVLKNLLYYLKNTSIPLTYLNKYSHDIIRNESKIKMPSTGLTVFYYIFQLLNKNKNNIKLYGFSFLQNKIDENCPHYFKDKNQDYKTSWHSFLNESEFFKTIYQ